MKHHEMIKTMYRRSAEKGKAGYLKVASKEDFREEEACDLG